MSRPWILSLVLAAAAMVCAVSIDARVAGSVHVHNLGPVLKGSWIAKVVKSPGDFRFTLGVAALIVIVNAGRWPGAVELLAAGAVGGLFYTIVKWSVGRTRPFSKRGPFVPPFEFHPFFKGIPGLWRAENQSFPSGHACLAFATATVLALLYPRGRVAFFLIAALVAAERVMEGAHYPSDVVAGAILGVTSGWAMHAIFRRMNHQADSGQPRQSAGSSDPTPRAS